MATRQSNHQVAPELLYPMPKRGASGATREHDKLPTIRTSWHLLSEFQNACYRNGSSMSDVIRSLIAAYIAASAPETSRQEV